MILRIKPHFAPVTSRSCFSPERVLCPPSFASRKVFEPEGPLLNSPGRVTVLALDKEISLGDETQRLPLVPKPKDANRLSEGHNLRKFCLAQLQWGEAKYHEIQVRHNTRLNITPVFKMSFLRNSLQIWSIVIWNTESHGRVSLCRRFS